MAKTTKIGPAGSKVVRGTSKPVLPANKSPQRKAGRLAASKSEAPDESVATATRRPSKQAKGVGEMGKGKPKSGTSKRRVRGGGRSEDPPGAAEKAISAQRVKTKAPLALKPPKPPYPPQNGKVMIKAQQTVTLENGRKIAIGGLRDEFDTKYVSCRAGSCSTLTPYAAWHGGSGGASTALRDQGLVIVSKIGDVGAAVAKLTSFPRAPIVTKPGWSRFGFAQSNGRVIVPDGQPEPLKAFSPASGLLDASGTLESWIQQVATPISEHLLASFFMMVMFSASLLRFTNRADNFGFELSGDAGRGKTTLQLLMASAAGPAIGDASTTYWRSLNTTMNALETVMPVYADMPLILDEAGLVHGAGKRDTRGQAMREMAFHLAGGAVKHRLGEPTGPRSRLVFVLSTNRPIASLLGPAHAAENDAVADRLITLPLLSDRPFGIFDDCPPAYASTGAFADALKQGASEHYGHALPVFLQYLVNEEAENPERLRRRIKGSVDRFVAQSATDTNDGSRTRVANAMGLVYAGGRAAQAAGVLPRTYRCLEAAQAALDLHTSHGRRPTSFADRLRALLYHPDTIDLSKTDIGSIPAATLKKCPQFIYEGRSLQRELVVPVEQINRVFSNWNASRNDPDVRQRLKVSSDRNTRDRPVGLNGAERPVYCFDITDLE